MCIFSVKDISFDHITICIYSSHFCVFGNTSCPMMLTSILILQNPYLSLFFFFWMVWCYDLTVPIDIRACNCLCSWYGAFSDPTSCRRYNSTVHPSEGSTSHIQYVLHFEYPYYCMTESVSPCSSSWLPAWYCVLHYILLIPHPLPSRPTRYVRVSSNC